MKYLPPGLIVAILLVLIVSQLCFAFFPYRRRAYVPILVMTAIGFGLGQVWDFIGLPSWRLGQANFVPGLIFALLLQPLTRFFPSAKRSEEKTQPGSVRPPT